MPRRPGIAAFALGTGSLLCALAAVYWWLGVDRTAFYTDNAGLATDARQAAPRDVLWRPPEPLGAAINAPAHEGSPAIDPSGDVVYLSRSSAEGDMDLFMARRSGAGWGEPTPLASLNSPDNEMGARASPDGQWLYFASDRPGGLGGTDLWRAPRLDEGGWGEPEPLGPGINSRANELHPFPAPDGPNGPVVYFASDRLGTEGADPSGFDLFRGTPGVGGPPQAISELNSLADDTAPALSPAGDFLYFSSNREGSLGGFDLYRARLLPDGFGSVEHLDASVNTPANELEPSVSMEGFALQFASDREGGMGGTDLYEAISREVYLQRDTRFAGLLGDLLRLLPWVLALVALILLLAMLRRVSTSGAWEGRFNALSLMAKCLLVSLLLHALLLLALSMWEVRLAPGQEGEGGSPVQVSLASRAAGPSIAQQVRGAMTEAEVRRVEVGSAPEPVPTLHLGESALVDTRAAAQSPPRGVYTPLEVGEPPREAQVAIPPAAAPGSVEARTLVDAAVYPPSAAPKNPEASRRGVAADALASSAPRAVALDDEPPAVRAVAGGGGAVTVDPIVHRADSTAGRFMPTLDRSEATPVPVSAESSRPGRGAPPEAVANSTALSTPATGESPLAQPEPPAMAARTEVGLAGTPEVAPGNGVAPSGASLTPEPTAPAADGGIVPDRATRDAEPDRFAGRPAVAPAELQPADFQTAAATPSSSGPDATPAPESAPDSSRARPLAAIAPSIATATNVLDAPELVPPQPMTPGIPPGEQAMALASAAPDAATVAPAAPPAVAQITLSAPQREVTAGMPEVIATEGTESEANIEPARSEIRPAMAPSLSPRMPEGVPEAILVPSASASAGETADLALPPNPREAMLGANTASPVPSQASPQPLSVHPLALRTPGGVAGAISAQAEMPAPEVERSDHSQRPADPPIRAADTSAASLWISPALAPVLPDVPMQSLADMAEAGGLAAASPPPVAKASMPSPPEATLVIVTPRAATRGDIYPGDAAAAGPMLGRRPAGEGAGVPAIDLGAGRELARLGPERAAPSGQPVSPMPRKSSPDAPATPTPGGVLAGNSLAPTAQVTLELGVPAAPRRRLQLTGHVVDHVTDRPVEGALVRLELVDAPELERTTGPEGTFDLDFDEIPDHVALVSTAKGYFPGAIDIAEADLVEGLHVVMRLTPVNRFVVPLDDEARVRHLGNDEYTGLINSQFQKRAEGTSVRFVFELDADQMPPHVDRAEIVMLAKGAQLPNPLFVNDIRLRRTLSDSPADGSFGEASFWVPLELLRVGRNELEIHAIRQPGTDIDDFEIVNVRLVLRPAGSGDPSQPEAPVSTAPALGPAM